MLGEITVQNGAVVQNNFDDYPVLRIDQTPKKIFVHIVEGDNDRAAELMSGESLSAAPQNRSPAAREKSVLNTVSLLESNLDSKPFLRSAAGSRMRDEASRCSRSR